MAEFLYITRLTEFGVWAQVLYYTMTETLPQSIHSRAKWHSYDEGLFFITYCSYRHRPYFGKIEYLNISEYIDSNVANWRNDCFLQGM